MQKSFILPVVAMIAILVSLQAVSEYEVVPDAYGLKSKGNALTQTNSDLVCGDRLCSEMKTDEMKTHEVTSAEINTNDISDEFSYDGKCDEQDLENFVYYWFSLYDARADSSSILESVDDDFKIVFLDTVAFTNSDDFENWYQRYLENFEYVEHNLRTFAAFEIEPEVYLASYTADAKMIEHDGTTTEGLYQYSVVFSTHNNQIKIVEFFSTQLDDRYLNPQFDDQTYRMSDHNTIVEEGKYIIKKVFFPCSGEQCAGYLYLPYDLPSGEKAPGIVMSNAITSAKEITLPNYGKAFAEAGYVALGIDYRYWGESGGQPRNHIVGYEQQQDIRDAITWL